MSQDTQHEEQSEQQGEWFDHIYAMLRQIVGPQYYTPPEKLEQIHDYHNLLDMIWTTFSNGDPTFMLGMTQKWFDRWLWTPLYDEELDQPYPCLIAVYVRDAQIHTWYRALLGGPDITQLEFQDMSDAKYTYALYPVNWRSVVQQQWHV